MNKVRLNGAMLIALFAAGCGGTAPTPSAPTASAPTDIITTVPIPSGPCVIGFVGLTVNAAPFETHAACDLTITARAAAWRASTTYGAPPPFIQFIVPGGSTLTGVVTLDSPHAPFKFISVDIYSSTTQIPYEITGEAAGVETLSLHGVQGNTYGAFATVSNPHGVAVDRLTIRLTNPAAPCCTNPVGLDNIRITR